MGENGAENKAVSFIPPPPQTVRGNERIPLQVDVGNGNIPHSHRSIRGSLPQTCGCPTSVHGVADIPGLRLQTAGGSLKCCSQISGVRLGMCVFSHRKVGVHVYEEWGQGLR